MTEKQFADAAGVSRGAVQQWERVGGTAPKRANQSQVAQLLGISIAELVLGGPNVSVTPIQRTVVPLVSTVEAGSYTTIDNFAMKTLQTAVRVSVPVHRHTYAMRVHGDSMVSTFKDSFPDGSIIIVEPEMSAQSGDYVIAMDADGNVTFKHLVKDGSDLYLRSLNPRYPIRPLNPSRIIGVVREFTKLFR